MKKVKARWSRSRVPLVAVAGVLSSACSAPIRAKPCVEGVEPGDTLGVTLLEEYDEESSYAFDLPVFFGPGATTENTNPFCDFGRDLTLGETLTVDVVERHHVDDGGDCEGLGLSVRGTEKTSLGAAATSARFFFAGNIRLGSAIHPSTTVNGCLRGWQGYFIVRDGAGPFDAAVPGEVPPALLLRRLEPTGPECAYNDPLNVCLLVVQMEQL